MKSPEDVTTGRIVGYDPKRQELLIRAPYDDYKTMLRREYKTCLVQLVDSRPLSDRQRRACYAMIDEIAEYMGEDKITAKEFLKIEFMAQELHETADKIFSLSNAPMSLVCAFQKFVVNFIVRNDIPTKKPMLAYVDDVREYVYACLIARKCAVCGRRAELHHVDRIGMGRDRTDVIHVGLECLPLCRGHHTEAHTMPDTEFFEKYHLDGGIEIDRTVCKIYGLKGK